MGFTRSPQNGTPFDPNELSGAKGTYKREVVLVWNLSCNKSARALLWKSLLPFLSFFCPQHTQIVEIWLPSSH
ncbi:hypothetical protein RJT34_27603 [Clitoria ternatea]|uniref:Uncharacterized protein n=1 Tax=Clitoria ternatea TaxID=43366 RepID=A0AAN9F9Z1_CLITE